MPRMFLINPADLRLMLDEFGISICVENMPKSYLLFYSYPGLDPGISLDALLAEQISRTFISRQCRPRDDHLPLSQ
ncbi:Uncharacterised protein [uncultured archaeon]|nr:Uncharacterised protein [uncultured archaeon]